MTGRRVQLQFLAVVVAAATLLQCTAARRTFVVGDGLGWAVPSNPNTYAIWASNHSFAVNDILLFKFVSGNNTVAKVSKEAYEACDTSITPMFIRRQSPAFIFLNTTGDKFFIDTVGDHCRNGLKLAIEVNPLSPAPTPTPSPPTPSPPPGTPQSPTGSPPPALSPTTSPPPSPPSNTPPSNPSPPPGTPSPSTAPPPSLSSTPPVTPSPPPGTPSPSTAPTPTTSPSPVTTPGPALSPPLSSSSPPTSTAAPLPPPPSRSAASTTYSSLAAVLLSFALGYLIWD